jgi:hypothetical protein
MSEAKRDYFGHVVGQYRPTTGQEIRDALEAKELGLKPHPRGYHLKAEIEEFLQSVRRKP